MAITQLSSFFSKDFCILLFCYKTTATWLPGHHLASSMMPATWYHLGWEVLLWWQVKLEENSVHRPLSFSKYEK